MERRIKRKRVKPQIRDRTWKGDYKEGIWSITRILRLNKRIRGLKEKGTVIKRKWDRVNVKISIRWKDKTKRGIWK